MVLADYKKLISEFISIKSVSTDVNHSKDMVKTADWLKNILTKGGFKTELWTSKEANPVVFSEYSLPESTVHEPRETILIYGHYDVQPAKKSDGWKSEPFELYDDGKKLFGRGIVDNKGEHLVHIVTILNLIKENKLKYNVKFLIEGNEETGNSSLGKLMEKNRKKLKCNVVLVSDGELTNNNPSMEVSFRGGFNCTLTYKTAKNNLHSGMWGGGVPNAAQELSKFLSKLYNSKNQISFDGFNNGIDKLKKEELLNNKRLLKEAHSIEKLAGVKALLMESGYDFFTATGLRSTIQITGLKSGYIDNGYSNIVPAEAEARLNFRLASSQNAKEIVKAFEKFIKKETPKYVDYTLSIDGPHNPVKISTENKYVKMTESLLEKVYRSKVNKRYVGGAIPFIVDVKRILGVDTLAVPLVNVDCNMHGANENFDIKLLEKALEFSRVFFSIDK